MKKSIMIPLLLVSLILCAATAGAEDQLTTKVNIVLQDGTIMLYAGEDAGIKVGDEFEVTRGGEVVGHIKASKTKKLFTYADLVDGDVQEMDNVVRTTKASAPAPKAEKAEPKEEKKDSGKTSSSSRTTSSRSTSEEKPSRSTDREPSSKRRDEAKDTSKDTSKERKTERTAGEQPPPARPAPSPVYSSEKESRHKTQLAPIGMLRPAAFGLTGLLYMPTADVMPGGRGAAHFMYADADEDFLLYKDTGIGLTYGFGGNIEAAYTYVSTDLGTPASIGNGLSGDSRTNVFSFKYQFKSTNTIFDETTSASRYAAGLQYYDRNDSYTYSSGNSAFAADFSASATRIYAVSSHKYSMGVGHFGVYYQSGDIVDDTDYDGLGILAGLEYAFGESAAGGKDIMSFIVEYDSKAFYLGTYQTPSIGLRYNFREMGHLTLGMMDVSDSSVLLIEGAYDF